MNYLIEINDIHKKCHIDFCHVICKEKKINNNVKIIMKKPK